MKAHDPTAALIIIGNEILSGKFVDTNSPFLLEALFGLGVSVKRVMTIPDDIDVIAQFVGEAARKYDFVLTSGGVGPTHDDVTMAGVAAALGVPLSPHPELQRLLDGFFDGDVSPAAARMAWVPEGTRLLWREGLRYPQLVCGNVYIFPGVPRYLERKFLAIQDEFRGRPYHLIKISTRQREDQLAPHLEATLDAVPDIEIGSYPRFDEGSHWVLLTLQSKEPQRLEFAREDLCRRLDHSLLIDDGTASP